MRKGCGFYYLLWKIYLLKMPERQKFLMIYVDELERCPPCDPRGGRWRFKNYCRLWAPDVDQLHQFAQNLLDLKPEYFQNIPPSTFVEKGFPHYDLTAAKRRLARKHGAKPVTSAEMVTLARLVT